MNTEIISILQMGSERAVADLAVSVLQNNPEQFRAVLNCCFHQKYPISMRAARVIQLYCAKHPNSIYPFLEETVSEVLISPTNGVKRNFLKIFAEFIDINQVHDPGPLLNTCFVWMMDPNEAPAVRVLAIDVIYRISAANPDLLKELAACLEIIGQDNVPSINCKIVKINTVISGHNPHFLVHL